MIEVIILKTNFTVEKTFKIEKLGDPLLKILRNRKRFSSDRSIKNLYALEPLRRHGKKFLMNFIPFYVDIVRK